MSQFNWAGYPWTEVVRSTQLIRVSVSSVPERWGRIVVGGLQPIYIPAPIYVQFSASRGGATVYFPSIALDTFPTVLPLPEFPNRVQVDYQVAARAPDWVFQVDQVNGVFR